MIAGEVASHLGDRPSVGVLARLAAVGTVRFLLLLLRRLQLVTVALVLLLLFTLAAGALWGWWLPVVYWLVIVAASITLMFGILLLARAGVGGRILLVERSVAGWAFLTARPVWEHTAPLWRRLPWRLVAVLTGRQAPADRRLVWRPANLISRPSAHGRTLDRDLRPGAVLVARAIAIARAQQADVRVLAASGSVAEKVYLPAGLVYDSPRRCRRILDRPRLHLPPRCG